MRTVTFQSVLWSVARNMGLKPSENLSPDTAATLTDYINSEIRMAWGEFPWPELVPCEQRWFRPVWEESGYDAGSEVYHEETDAYYLATGDALLTDVPGVATVWEEITSLDRYVAYGQSGQLAIGDVIGVYDGNPRESGVAQLVPWWMTDNGLQFGTAAPSSVWVEYRLAESIFTADVYDSSATYVTGQRVYDPSTGECYLAIDASIDSDPEYSPDQWSKILFPAFLGPAVIAGATAKAKEEDGHATSARTYRADRESLLVREMSRYAVTQGGMVRYGARRVRSAVY